MRHLLIASFLAVTGFVSTPVLVELTAEDIAVDWLELPRGELVDQIPQDSTIAFLGPFHNIQRPWWPEADTWELPSKPSTDATDAVTAAEGLLAQMNDVLARLEVDPGIADSLRLYPAVRDLFGSGRLPPKRRYGWHSLD